VRAVAVVVWVSLLAAAPAARAQDVRDVLAADARAELDALEAQQAAATGLYVSAGILLGGGAITLLVGSSGTLTCEPPEDCSPWEIAIAVGAILAAVGLPLLIVATFVEGDASDARRRVLRESLSLRIGPRPGGAELGLTFRF